MLDFTGFVFTMKFSLMTFLPQTKSSCICTVNKNTDFIVGSDIDLMKISVQKPSVKKSELNKFFVRFINAGQNEKSMSHCDCFSTYSIKSQIQLTTYIFVPSFN